MTSDKQTLLRNDSLKAQFKKDNRRRRKSLAGFPAQSLAPLVPRNDLKPKLEFLSLPVNDLRAPSKNVRKCDPGHVREIANSLAVYGDCAPILIGKNNNIIDGVNTVEAAKHLEMDELPCVRISHLSDAQEEALRISLNRLGEKGEWDIEVLGQVIEEIFQSSPSQEIPGLSGEEVDQIFLHGEAIDGLEEGPVEPEDEDPPVAQLGDLFILGTHKVICGDATGAGVLAELMKDDPPAAANITDPPYNLDVSSITRGPHKNFAMASGEMSDEQFLQFLEKWLLIALPFLRDGALLAIFIDWRGHPFLHSAAMKVGLAMLNLIVWMKNNAGMGSLYRSQHELVLLLKNGTAPHVNNVQLGKKGRWRSNVWQYPGASSLGSDARRGLKEHPTVKPTAMLEDALLDITNRGDIVLDPFLGSGSTLMAAEATGRICRGVELDPRYIDVIVRRYEKATKKSAIFAETRETFAALAARRAAEAVAEAPSANAG